jgi:hypothetical protein
MKKSAQSVLKRVNSVLKVSILASLWSVVSILGTHFADMLLMLKTTVKAGLTEPKLTPSKLHIPNR